MEGIIKICDHCKYEAQSITGQIGGYPAGYDWITVTRCSSNSGEKIGVGIYHFCCDRCLSEHIKRNDQIMKNHPSPFWKSGL